MSDWMLSPEEEAALREWAVRGHDEWCGVRLGDGPCNCWGQTVRRFLATLDAARSVPAAHVCARCGATDACECGACGGNIVDRSVPDGLDVERLERALVALAIAQDPDMAEDDGEIVAIAIEPDEPRKLAAAIARAYAEPQP